MDDHVTIRRVPQREHAQSEPLCELRPGGQHPLAGAIDWCGTFADYLVKDRTQDTADEPGEWATCCACLEAAVSYELPEAVQGCG